MKFKCGRDQNAKALFLFQTYLLESLVFRSDFLVSTGRFSRKTSGEQNTPSVQLIASPAPGGLFNSAAPCTVYKCCYKLKKSLQCYDGISPVKLINS